MKRTQAFILPIIIILAAFLLLNGCKKADSNIVTPQMYEIKYNEPVLEQKGNVFFRNRFYSVGTPPFTLPRETADSSFFGEYEYNDFTETEYDEYISRLEKEGFKCVKLKYEAFCRKDGCLISIFYPKDGRPLRLIWYARSEHAPKDGISEEQAAEILCQEGTLSKISLTPVDVTPEGFFERTGGQIFVLPVYSFDTFLKNGEEKAMFDANENYNFDVYFIRDGKAFVAGMECVACADFDNDGEDEVCTLSYGGTSGIFTFLLSVINKSGEDVGDFFSSEHYYLSFSEKEGSLVVHAETQNGEQIDFDIVADDSPGNKRFTLMHNGERPSLWKEK